MNKGSQSNQFIDEWALFVKAVSFLALLTGLLYLRVMIGGAAPLTAGNTILTTGATRVLIVVIALAGLILCWQRPVLGAAIAILAGLLLGWQVYETAAHAPLVLTLAYASPFVLTGALYLLYARHQGAL